MYRTLEDFLEDHKELAGGSTRLFERLTDGNLGQPVTGDHRTLGGIAWHLVVSIPEMMNRTGLGLSSVDSEAPPPTSAAEIRKGYAKASSELAAAVRSQWKDATLLQKDDMYGETWARGKTLAVLVHHEIHHRGQMTVLLRQAGSTVPGIFGPSKEEWSGFGMAPPSY